MKKIQFRFVCALLWLTMLSTSAFSENIRLHDRKVVADNDQLRRTVQQDREAARRAHEKETVKLRDADTRRLATMESSKKRYQQVLTEREAVQKRGPQAQQLVRQQQVAEKSAQHQKQKNR